MKLKIIIIFLLLSSIIFSAGCNFQASITDESSNFSDSEESSTFADTEKRELTTEEKIMQINTQLTRGTALNLFGTPRPNEFSIDYPIVHTWEFDGGLLYIFFETDNREEFIEAYKRGDFILPEETVIYSEDGIRHATENQKKVLKEWLDNHTAVKAYIIKDNNKTFLLNPDD